MALALLGSLLDPNASMTFVAEAHDDSMRASQSRRRRSPSPPGSPLRRDIMDRLHQKREEERAAAAKRSLPPGKHAALHAVFGSLRRSTSSEDAVRYGLFVLREVVTRSATRPSAVPLNAGVHAAHNTFLRMRSVAGSVAQRCPALTYAAVVHPVSCPDEAPQSTLLLLWQVAKARAAPAKERTRDGDAPKRFAYKAPTSTAANREARGGAVTWLRCLQSAADDDAVRDTLGAVAESASPVRNVSKDEDFRRAPLSAVVTLCESVRPIAASLRAEGAKTPARDRFKGLTLLAQATAELQPQLVTVPFCSAPRARQAPHVSALASPAPADGDRKQARKERREAALASSTRLSSLLRSHESSTRSPKAASPTRAAPASPSRRPVSLDYSLREPPSPQLLPPLVRGV